MTTPSSRKRLRTDNNDDLSHAAPPRRHVQVPARVKNSGFLAEPSFASSSGGPSAKKPQVRTRAAAGPIRSGDNEELDGDSALGVHIYNVQEGQGKEAKNGDWIHIYYKMCLNGGVVAQSAQTPFRLRLGGGDMLEGNV